MKKHILLALGILLLALFAGCKSNKEMAIMAGEASIAQKNEERKFYNEMIEAYGSWDTVVANGSVAMGGLSSPFELRMIRNEAIQISLRPLLGIEVARVIITQESVTLYDKVSKRYSTADMAALQEKLPFPLTLNNIQSIFLGKPFLLGNEDLLPDNFQDFDIEIATPKWIMTPKATTPSVSYLFDMEGLQLNLISGRATNTAHTIDCSYSDYEVVSNRIVPTMLKATATGSSKSYSAEIYYNTVTFNAQTTIDSSSFRNYNEILMMDLIQSFLK